MKMFASDTIVFNGTERFENFHTNDRQAYINSIIEFSTDNS